jgi:lysophospholipase L1-like esterase
VRGLLNWLRLVSAYFMVGCSIVSAKTGCAGKHYNPAVDPLPQSSMVWIRRHEEKRDEARRRAGQVDLLFVGDSITQNYERTDSKPFLNIHPVWDQLFAPHRAMNLGCDADRTGHVLWRLRHGEVDGLQPKDIVLLIGANNLNPSSIHPSAEQIAAGTAAVIDELHRRMPAARILVLSVLPSSFSAERTARTDALNAAVQAHVTTLAYARFLDVSPLFLDGSRLRSELFYDPIVSPGSSPVHPTAAGQRLMAEAVAKALYGR